MHAQFTCPQCQCEIYADLTAARIESKHLTAQAPVLTAEKARQLLALCGIDITSIVRATKDDKK